MDFEFLSVLTEPAFVIPCNGVGVVSAVWVLYDTLTHNQHVNQPLKAGWPIIVTFFSVIGLVLYF